MGLIHSVVGSSRKGPPDSVPSSLGSINAMRSHSSVYNMLYDRADLKVGVGLI